MADDLVAQLTLQLRDDITAGLQPLQDALSSLDDSVSGLRDVMSGLNDTIASLQAPVALTEGLTAARSAATEAAGGIAGIGTAADISVRKIDALADDIKALHAPAPGLMGGMAGDLAGAGSAAGGVATAVAGIGTAADTSVRKVGALADDIKALHAPAPGLMGGLAGDLGDAATAASGVATAVAGIGTAADTSIHKVESLATEIKALRAPQVDLPAAPPDTPLVPYSRVGPDISTFYGEQGFDYDGSSRGQSSAGPRAGGRGRTSGGDGGAEATVLPEAPGHAMDMLGGALAAFLGLDAITAYADFQNVGLHAAITEKMSGQQAEAEAQRIMGMLQPLALKTATPSEDLAEAYYFLVTTGMDKGLINQMMPALATTSTAYNVPVPQMTQAAFTLNENLGISAADMGPALAMLAYAAKLGHFTLADFGEGLPEIGGQLNKLGMRGEGSEDVAASALEILRRNTGQSGEAATELQDLVMYLTSPMGTRMFDQTKKSRDLMSSGVRKIFDKYHIAPLDIPAYLNKEREHGVDPLDAMIDYFHKILTPITSPTDRAFVVGGLMHNQAAQQAMLSLVQYYDDYQKDKQELSKVNPDVVATDFSTAMGGAIVQVRLFHEEMDQLERDLGQGLLPLLKGVNDIAKPFIAAIDLVNHNASIMGTGLGDLNIAVVASYVAFRTLLRGAGALSGVFSRLAGGGAAAAAGGAGAEAAEAGGAAAAGAGAGIGAATEAATIGARILAAARVTGLGLAVEGVTAEVLAIHQGQMAAMQANTEALNKNSESKTTTVVVNPNGTIQTIGPGGVGTFTPPQPSKLPFKLNAPAPGQVLGRP